MGGGQTLKKAMDIEMRERSSRHRDSAGRKKNQSPRPLLSTSPYLAGSHYAGHLGVTACAG